MTLFLGITVKKAEIHRMVSASVTVPDTTRVILESIFKVPKKLRFRGKGMICLDPKKVVFFDFVIIQIW